MRNRAVFSPDVLLAALRRMVLQSLHAAHFVIAVGQTELSDIPLLLMRTLLQTLAAAPLITSQCLVRARVWRVCLLTGDVLSAIAAAAGEQTGVGTGDTLEGLAIKL